MNSLTLDAPVGQLVTERPRRSLVFERLGIDYCCGGKLRLADACAAKALDPVAVLRDLETCDAAFSTQPETDWSKVPLRTLVNHIVATHHDYLREELPRLGLLIEKIVRAHGEQHRELLPLHELFISFRRDLEAHMAKEEQVLFPVCRDLEGAPSQPQFHCGSIRNPIRVMVTEHDDTGAALVAMRLLTRDFTAPDDACVTYRAMLSGLAEIEHDMHHHVHLENNILFPRAIDAEASLGTSE
jgi:regulator of cell morphogenesis and NO signaling